MTALHAHFHLRNQSAFRRALGDRDVNVNARDWLGRTALHLACAEPAAVEYTRMLLSHAAVDPNIPDVESRWTSLHRALYAGNIAAA